MHKAIVTGVLLWAASGAALAADNGFYLGGAIGSSNLEIDDIAGIDAADFEGDDTGYKFIAGFRPLDWLAVEASYVNFGETDDDVLGTRIEAEADGISAFAVGFLAAGPVDLFAKAGLISWDSKLSVRGIDVSDDADGTDLAYGVGAQIRLLSLGVRAEYELFDVDDVEDLSMISLGVTYTFL